MTEEQKELSRLRSFDYYWSHLPESNQRSNLWHEKQKLYSESRIWPHIIHELKPDYIAKGWGITVGDVKECWTNGANTSCPMEFVMARKLKGKRAPTKTTDFDIEYVFCADKDEIRCLTDGDVNFGPSSNTGKGRYFTLEGFMDKNRKIKYFFVCVVNEATWPKVLIYVISARIVLIWFNNGKISKKKNTSLVAYAKFFTLMEKYWDEIQKDNKKRIERRKKLKKNAK